MSDKIINSFERPEFADESLFLSTVSRTILNGATTGFVVRTDDPEGFSVSPTPAGIYKMVPTVTTTASSDGSTTGTYYDALVPLNTTNRSGTLYIWVDIDTAGTYTMGDATAIVTMVGTLPAVPTKPMMMLMPNSFLTQGHYGEYVGGSEDLGVPYLEAMIAHRLHPHGSLVVEPPISGGLMDIDYLGTLSFDNQVVHFSPSRQWIPTYDTSSEIAAADATALAEGWPNPWFYTMDEPQDFQATDLDTLLALQKLYAPHIKRMVTTDILYSDGDLDADIFCPIADQFDYDIYPDESGYVGKELWLYVSCASHGCGVDLAADLGADRVEGTQSGVPDLVMDRSGAEPFGYMLLAQKYPSVQALLYYNTVEQYKMNATAYGLDMWAGETFNFGGNLDGTLFWPGRVGIQGLTSEQPIVSVRMKLLREAQNLADTLSMLDPDWVQTRADAIMTNPRTWTRDVSVFDTLQQDAIALLGATLTLSTSGTGIDQTYTIECTDQFRLVWDAGDNWGLCEWYDLVNDPTAANNLAGPGLPSGVTPDATIAEPGLFQQVFYQTDPDDCKTFTRSAKNYFPSTPRSFEVIENTPTRMQVASTCHPMVTAQGVLTDITVRVEYVITPDGQIKVTARTTATSGTTIGEWRNAVLGLQNPGGTGTTPPDVTGGWVRATSVQNPYSDTGTSPSYLFSYWDQTTGSNISYSKASVLLVPKSTNPTEGLPFNHSWNDWMRWGYRYPSGITISAGQTVTQRYLIQLGTEDSSILPDIKTSTVADPIAAAYQAESDSAATHTSQNFRRIGFFLN